MEQSEEISDEFEFSDEVDVMRHYGGIGNKEQEFTEGSSSGQVEFRHHRASLSALTKSQLGRDIKL